MKSRFLDVIMKFLVFLTIFLWILALVKPELVKSLVEWVQSGVQSLGYWNYVIIFFSSLIEAFPVLWIVVPGQNIMIVVGGFFGNIDQTHLIYSIIIASIGAIFWNYIGYILWVYYGKYFFKHYGVYFWLWKTEVKYLEAWVKKWWPLGVTLWKFHNVARAFIPFIAGSMEMKSSLFMFYNIVGSIIRATSMILIGVVFAANYEIIIDYIGYFFIWIIIIAIAYIYFFKREAFMRYIEEKSKEIDEQIEASKNK